MMNNFLRRLFFILVVFLISFVLGSCSLRKLLVIHTQPLIEELQKSVLDETQEEISKGALPFAIKFAEGFYYYYPQSPYYSSKLALLYGAYTFAYMDSGPYGDFDEEAEKKKKQVIVLYKKAFDYGMKSMNARIEDFSEKVYKKEEIDALLAQVEKEDVEALFWFNFSWALMIFEDLGDVKNLSALESIKKIAERIIELEEDYLYGASYAILCAYYGARTQAIGGDIQKAQEMYQKAFSISKDKSLIPAYVMLRFVSIQQLNTKLFDFYYGEIKDFDVSKNKEFSYVNTFLKRKAKILYTRKKEIFD